MKCVDKFPDTCSVTNTLNIMHGIFNLLDPIWQRMERLHREDQPFTERMS